MPGPFRKEHQAAPHTQVRPLVSRMVRGLAAAGALAVVLAACSGGSSAQDTPSSSTVGQLFDQAFTAPALPALDPASVAEGEQLYAQNCASCHMPDRSGQPNWKVPNDDGTYPPPPHDNSGHTWHHEDDLLLGIVRDGLDGAPSGMPRFKSILSDDDILSILDYLKSEWGETERKFQWQVTWQQDQ